MRTLLFCALLAGVLSKRNDKAAEQLAAAKAAYQDALARTGDFDCTAPEFDQVLKMFDAVPAATPSKAEAKDLAKSIREKRALAVQHTGAVDRAAAAPIAAAPSADPPATATPADCASAQKRMRVLAAARKKSGRPPLGQTAFLQNGEVGYAPGAEPSAEEESLMGTLKNCGR